MYAADLGIHIIRNVPYRADLNGCEFYWKECKHVYRKEVDRLRSFTYWWDNLSTVENIVENVPEWKCTLAFVRGMVAIKYAKPIHRLHYEKQEPPPANHHVFED